MAITQVVQSKDLIEELEESQRRGVLEVPLKRVTDEPFGIEQVGQRTTAPAKSQQFLRIERRRVGLLRLGSNKEATRSNKGQEIRMNLKNRTDSTAHWNSNRKTVKNHILIFSYITSYIRKSSHL